MRYLWLISLSLTIFMGCEKKVSQWVLPSPSGNIEIIISQTSDSLTYEVKYANTGENGQTIIRPSPLGLVREDADFSKDLTFVSAENVREFSTSYTLTSGKQSEYKNKGNELVLHFSAKNVEKLDLVFRSFDNGVAFRYEFPEQDAGTKTVIEETSGFLIPENSKAWLQAYDTITKWTPAYERYFENGIEPGTPAPVNNGWAFPALFKLENHWILLSEADLDGGYFAGHLNNEIGSQLYTIRLPEEEEAINTGQNVAVSQLPWKTPWRVIMIGNTLGDIVKNNLITDLSKPTNMEDVSWIEPGTSSWSWWSDSDSPQDYDKLTRFIDFSAEMGWEYTLVDANWNLMEGGNLEQLAEYANEKGVGLLVWYNSGGPHNIVTEQPRDIMYDPDLRKAEMKKLQSLGIRGIKVDFFQSDKQHIIQQYIDIIKDAAAHQIMVNFHGCTIPRGWRRTYPNVMTMESVRGAECYKFDSTYPEMAPYQNTVLPFTRNVIGPMDYTPMTFSDNTYPHLTTDAHEAALGVVFESGWQHLADAADSYRRVPDPVKEYLMRLPASWDETHLVTGYPGKEVIMARRKGEVWYVAGINGENGNKSFSLSSFPFLNLADYHITLIQDGDDPQTFDIAELPAGPGQSLKVQILGYGGFVAILKPSSKY